MRQWWAGFFLLLFLIIPVQVPAATDLFVQGNQACSRGDYAIGIDRYLEFGRSHGYSASLLYNLGNCYAAQGRVGRAIVNYERALLLTSGDGDIRANLRQVRKQAGLYDRRPSWYRQGARLLTADRWALIAVVSFVLAATLFLALQWRSRPNTILSRSMWFLFVLTLIAAGGAFFQDRRLHCGVVVVPDGRLRISPFPEAEVTGQIREGRLVCPLKSHDGYFLVRESSGRQGWLPKKEISLLAELPH